MAVPQTQLAKPPRAKGVRHDQWTRAKMVGFLRELAASQSVAHAAKSQGMSRQSAYRLRDRLVGTPFALGWEVALEAGLSQLAHAMLDRAVNGVEVPHYYKGELVGTSRHFDERLAIWIASNPWKVGRQQMAREYTDAGWDALLQRVEEGPLDWDGAEMPDGREPEDDGALIDPERAAERDRDEFFNRRSWYGANLDIGEDRPGRARR